MEQPPVVTDAGREHTDHSQHTETLFFTLAQEDVEGYRRYKQRTQTLLAQGVSSEEARIQAIAAILEELRQTSSSVTAFPSLPNAPSPITPRRKENKANNVAHVTSSSPYAHCTSPHSEHAMSQQSSIPSLHPLRHHSKHRKGNTIIKGDNTPSSRSPLTTRQREGLTLLAQGYHHKEIAEQMGIEVTTVRSHLYKAAERLGVQHIGAAVYIARQRGLLLE